MMISGLNLEALGEAVRISVRGYRRAVLRVTADDATLGAIEIQRGYGFGGPLVPYKVAKTISINGSATLTIVVDDCPELALVVTTVGVGTFDLEYALDDPAQDILESITVDLESPGGVWGSSPLTEFNRRVTIVTNPSDAILGVGGAAIEAREFVDQDGQSSTISGVVLSLDSTATSFDLLAVSAFEIYCTVGQADLSASVWIYSTQIIK